MAATTLYEQLAFRAEAGASNLELAVLKTLAEGRLLSLWPFIPYEGGAYPFLIQDEMPKVSPRLINEKNETVRGSVTQGAETFKNYGADVTTDKSVLALHGFRAHNEEILSTAQSMRMTIEAALIRGETSADGGRSMDGLRTRLTAGSSQRLDNTSGSGAGLSFGALDELIAAVDGDETEKKLIFPKKIYTKLGKAQRTPSISGNIDFAQNAVGRRVPFYGDVEIIPVDVDSQNIDIIGFDEASSTCSVYCVNMGEGKVFGIEGPSLDENNQPRPGLVVYDVGESTSMPMMVTRISYHVSMVLQNPKMAASLGKITNTDIMA